jgi:rRNA maturation RNase YbeY
LNIFFHFEQARYKISSQKKRKKWIYTSVEEEGYSVDSIDFIFCSDIFLLGINKKFLKHDYFTDVITFSNSEGINLSGEIYISLDRVKENSESYQVSFDEELNRILIHGILHLMNYDDSTRSLKMRMTIKENYFLKKF